MIVLAPAARCLCVPEPSGALPYTLQGEQQRIAIIGGGQVPPLESSLAAEQQLSPSSPLPPSEGGAPLPLPPPGTSSATVSSGSGLAEALNLAGSGAALSQLPGDDATDPELTSWVETLQQEVCVYV